MSCTDCADTENITIGRGVAPCINQLEIHNRVWYMYARVCSSYSSFRYYIMDHCMQTQMWGIIPPCIVLLHLVTPTSIMKPMSNSNEIDDWAGDRTWEYLSTYLPSQIEGRSACTWNIHCQQLLGMVLFNISRSSTVNTLWEPRGTLTGYRWLSRHVFTWVLKSVPTFW